MTARSGRSKRLHGQGGFSLAEVLTGVGLALILSSIALPNIGGFRSTYRLVAAADQIGFEITRAHMQAIGQNVFMRVRLIEGTQYAVERSRDGGATYPDTIATATLPTGITATAGANGIPVFTRNGIATADTTIAVSNGHTSKTIRTNILGRVTITNGTTGG